MKRAFTKMQGCGNDYIYFNCLHEPLDSPEQVSQRLSDRHFGIGGDGIILITPSEVADAKMRIFNADGSEAKMCGNGIRCVAKFLYDYQLVNKQVIKVDTQSGIKTLELFINENNQVSQVCVDMGKAILKPSDIPVKLEGDSIVNQPLEVAGNIYDITCVSMGNPHCILFVDEVASMNLEAIGPLFENHAIFPDKANIEFIKVLDSHTLEMRVWERGSGETLACGTGACASVVAATLNAYCPKGEPVTVKLRGGDLTITYTDETVLMKGPAEKVFEGEIEL